MRTSKIAKRIYCIASFFFAVLVLSVACLFYIFIEPTNDKDNNNNLKKNEMLKIIIAGGNLAPLPQIAKINELKTEGNLFTRSFRLNFESDSTTIKNWLLSSKGIKSAEKSSSNSSDIYVLHPQKRFSYGKVKVDRKHHLVAVYLSNS